MGKTCKVLWIVSFCVLAVAAIVLLLHSCGVVELPDMVVRVVGITCMCALVVGAFTSVVLRKK